MMLHEIVPEIWIFPILHEWRWLRLVGLLRIPRLGRDLNHLVLRPWPSINGLVWNGENLKSGNPWVFTIKFFGLSGLIFPIIQFYESICQIGLGSAPAPATSSHFRSWNDDRMVSYCGWLRNHQQFRMKTKQNGYFMVFHHFYRWYNKFNMYFMDDYDCFNMF